MALPLPSSLACSMLRPSGILGAGIPLSSFPDVDWNSAEAICGVKVHCSWEYF